MTYHMFCSVFDISYAGMRFSLFLNIQLQFLSFGLRGEKKAEKERSSTYKKRKEEGRRGHGDGVL